MWYNDSLMAVRTIKNKIIVEAEKKRDDITQTDSGLYLPDTATKDNFKKGIVFGVGEEVTTVKAGEVVYYGEFTGREVTINGADYVILTDDEVLAVL